MHLRSYGWTLFEVCVVLDGHYCIWGYISCVQSEVRRQRAANIIVCAPLLIPHELKYRETDNHVRRHYSTHMGWCIVHAVSFIVQYPAEHTHTHTFRWILWGAVCTRSRDAIGTASSYIFVRGHAACVHRFRRIMYTNRWPHLCANFRRIVRYGGVYAHARREKDVIVEGVLLVRAECAGR